MRKLTNRRIQKILCMPHKVKEAINLPEEVKKAPVEAKKEEIKDTIVEDKKKVSKKTTLDVEIKENKEEKLDK